MNYNPFPKNKLYNSTGMCFHVLQGTYKEPHVHVEHWECFIMSHGKIMHHLNGTEELIERQRLYLLKPQDYHYFSDVEGYESQHISFFIKSTLMKTMCDGISPSLYDDLLNHAKDFAVNLSESQMSDFVQDVQALQTIDSDDLETQAAYVKMVFAHVIKLVYRSLIQAEQNAMPAIIKKIVQSMKSEDGIGKNVEQICADYAYSHMQLSRLFKQYTGNTMASYFKQVKLNYARNLLENTNYNTLVISNMIGFSSLSHFTHEFKLWHGVSPAKYRHRFSNIADASSNADNTVVKSSVNPYGEAIDRSD